MWLTSNYAALLLSLSIEMPELTRMIEDSIVHSLPKETALKIVEKLMGKGLERPFRHFNASTVS